jgi:Glycosyltransferase family 6
MKIGIVVLCTNAYFPLGIRLIKRFMQFYTGEKEIVFFFFSDLSPYDYLPDTIPPHYEIEYIYTTNSNWVEGTDLKFVSILKLADRDIDFCLYLDSDTNINQPFTEEWFLGESVAGQHYADQDWMKTVKGFERNPRSKGYVPRDTKLPQVYTYGAFWGGSKEWVMNFCRTMLEWQKADKKWNYEPPTNDEAYSNAYFHYNPPSKLVLCKDFAFAISDKGGIGDPRYMDLDVSKIKEELRIHKNDNINIQNGIVIIES